MAPFPLLRRLPSPCRGSAAEGSGSESARELRHRRPARHHGVGGGTLRTRVGGQPDRTGDAGVRFRAPRGNAVPHTARLHIPRAARGRHRPRADGAHGAADDGRRVVIRSGVRSCPVARRPADVRRAIDVTRRTASVVHGTRHVSSAPRSARPEAGETDGEAGGTCRCGRRSHERRSRERRGQHHKPFHRQPSLLPHCNGSPRQCKLPSIRRIGAGVYSRIPAIPHMEVRGALPREDSWSLPAPSPLECRSGRRGDALRSPPL